MSKRLAAVFVFLALVCPAARAQVEGVRELAPGVYFWQGDRDKHQPANCTWVVFKDYVFVIDANYPWATREIMQKIKMTTDKPVRYVLDTHYHSDHAFGNYLYADAGATILCSEACSEELHTKGIAAWNSYKDPGGYSIEGGRQAMPGITYLDQIVFDDGTERLEISRMYGHTKGDSVVFLPKQGILITGDLVVTWKYGNNLGDRDADYDHWISVLDQMMHWNVKTVVPGHGAPSGIGALRVQRDYLADMLSQVRAAIQAGKTIDETVKTVDLSKHTDFGASAEINANSIRAMYRHLTARAN